MKRFLIRLSIYIAIIECWYFVLLGRGPNFNPPPDNTLVGDIAFYVGIFAVRWGVWILIYEGFYQAIRYIRRRKPTPDTLHSIPIPDTQPLSAIQHANNPTKPIDNP